MLLKKLNLNLFGFLLAISASIAYGHPHDLGQLIATWTDMDKSESWPEYLELDTMEIENEETFFAEQISEKISRLPLQELSKFSYSLLNQGIRKKILKNLFTDKAQIPSFCKAFTSINKKMAEFNFDDFEAKEKAEKKLRSSCKIQINQLLGGIFHADPRVYTFLHLAKEESQIRGVYTIYVASLVKPNSYLKYTFKL